MREFIGVVGSRDFGPLNHVERFIDSLTAGAVVVTGGWPDLRSGRIHTDGVDERAARWAMARQLATIIHPAFWRGRFGDAPYSPHAGKARNTLIVRDAERLVAFWDGKSSGTEDSIEKARAKRIPVAICAPDGTWRHHG